MKTELTENERIVLALMRGHHLNKEEKEVAKRKLHSMNISLKQLK